MTCGGLTQLVACGAQDVYLISNPHITFFKVAYRRHTNFAAESIEQHFTSAANFNRTGICEISRNGDLVTQILLKVKLPEVRFGGEYSNFGHVAFAWVRNVGHAIIEYSQLEIGGSIIDKEYGEWLTMLQDVSSNVGHDTALARMLGDVPELTTISTLNWDCPEETLLKNSYTLQVPLQFYFCRHNGLALPLIALQYHQVKIHIKFRPADQCYIASEAFKSFKNNFEFEDASLFVNYIFLDNEERHRFAQYSHEYLMEQVQHHDEAVSENSKKVKINLNHPVKAIYFAVKMGNYQGQKFMIYEPYDWNLARKNLAKSILLSQYDLDDYGYFNEFNYPNNNRYSLVDNEEVTYDPINPADPAEENKFLFNDTATFNKFDGTLLIGRLSPQTPLLKPKGALRDLRDKVDGIIKISTDYVSDHSIYPEVEKITRNDLTIIDLSIPLSKFSHDNRCAFIKGFDVIVWQHNNFGMLIDGSVNPITQVELKLNSCVRQSKRHASWYNYVEPVLRHKKAPRDGVNVMSFSLDPESHQPTGSCNFSRIDTATLDLTFEFGNGKYAEVFNSRDNKLCLFAVNYNVIRIMSGMCGTAYAN